MRSKRNTQLGHKLESSLYKNRSYLLICFLCLLLCGFSFIPILAPGIDKPSPVGPYLNNVFPDDSPSGTGGNWEVENVFPKLTFTDPLALLEVPFENSYYIVGKTGFVWQVTDSSSDSVKQVVLDISSHTKTGEDTGLLNAVLHPEFNQSGSSNRGYIYVYYQYRPNDEDSGNGSETFLRLSRFTRPDTSLNFDPNSEYVLIQTYDEESVHGGGGLFFDTEGLLYLTVGEAGVAFREETNQKINGRLMSGVLRIDVDQDSSRSHPIRRQQVDPEYIGFQAYQSFQQGYFIPNDNPWQDENGGVLEEFFAIGLRSPHRASIDPLTGKIWVGDVGEAGREEISVVAKGDNLQWPYLEGFSEGDPIPDTLIGRSTPPVYDYEHDIGNCIIGGFVYRGGNYDGTLDGKYIFGDHGSRNVWTYHPENGEVAFLVNIPDWGEGEKRGISSFATNSAGDIFVLKLYGQDEDGGVVYRLKQRNVVPDPPKLLSETRAFTDLNSLTPAPGIIPYAVNAPLWSDRAVKKRWIALPNDGTHDTAEEQIAFSDTDNWQFPAGTVFIKHFELPVDYNNPDITKRLETRFFVIAKNGAGYGVTYKWNDEGTDAELLTNSDTKDFTLRLPDGSNGTQTWEYPSRTDCLTCHNGNADFVLGVHTWQLNGNLTYPSGITDNQLNTWRHLGMFANPFDPADIPNFLQAAHLKDESATLGRRVRSYLDANCSHCHQPNGVEGIFDARYATPLEEQNIIWTFGASRNTPKDHYIVKPLDTSESELWIRDGSLGENAMPPLARRLVDEEYMAVLTEWINSLETEACNEVDLSSLKWEEATNGNGPVEVNSNNGGSEAGDGSLMMINGQEFPLGFGVQAPSQISFQTNGDYALLTAYVGVDDEMAGCEEASVQFEVYADTSLVFQSPVMKAGDGPLFIEVDIPGAQAVKLVVNDAGDGTACDLADWGNPRLSPCGQCIPNTSCNDGDPCTVNDMYKENCKCEGTTSDADGDGVPDACDTCPDNDDKVDVNNNGIPDACDECFQQAGQPCDDGDTCTVNDQYDENCNCLGIFSDTDNDGVGDGCDVCPGSDDTVDTNNNGVPDACEDCTAHQGQSCDDGNPCTINDQYDENCNCLGTLSDTDNDGVGDGCDVCPDGNDTVDLNNNGLPDDCEASNPPPPGMEYPDVDVYTDPISAETIIKYKVEHTAWVGITITDQNGEIMNRPVLPGIRRAGIYTLSINEELPAGEYIAQFHYEGKIIHKDFLIPQRSENRAKKISPNQSVFQDKALQVSIRPNPFHNDFKLFIKRPFAEAKRATIKILDINGRIIFQQYDAVFDEDILITSHRGWTKGVYLMHIHTSEYSFSGTIVKQ